MPLTPRGLPPTVGCVRAVAWVLIRFLFPKGSYISAESLGFGVGRVTGGCQSSVP